jgi:hypothetical protein
MNGVVMASGGTLNVDFGRLYQDRSLTQGDTTQAGWYANTGGVVKLKTIPVTTTSVNWGDRSDTTSPNLVNSVRLSGMTDLVAGGLNGAFIDPASATGLTDAIGFRGQIPK